MVTVDSTPEGRSLSVALSDDEITERLQSWTPPPLPEEYRKGVLGRYKKLVSSAHLGAVLSD
jgi:dihydroxyacid dehydratase/phosphogluconate dehydratase